MAHRRRSGSVSSRLLAAVLAGICVWHLAGRRGDSSSSSSSRRSDCPLVYQRLSVEDIRGWKYRPYLLGEKQQPTCSNCQKSGGWADICQFKGGQLCQDWQWQPIKDAWLQRGYELALTLTPCDLWPLLRGRTLWFMGDSQMLDFYKAAQCFMFEFWPDLQQRNVTEESALQEELSKLVVATCAPLLDGTSICYVRVDKGEDMYERVLPLLASSLPSLVTPSKDLLVANFGLHHGDHEEYGTSLAAFVEFYGRHAANLPRLLWQPTPPQHFVEGDGSGEYPGGQPPFKCGAIANFSVVGDGLLQLEQGKQDSFGILRGGWRNVAAEPVMRRAGVPVLPSYNESLWMHAFHRDNGAGLECTHFCHPSAPQTWVLALYRVLHDLQQQQQRSDPNQAAAALSLARH